MFCILSLYICIFGWPSARAPRGQLRVNERDGRLSTPHHVRVGGVTSRKSCLNKNILVLLSFFPILSPSLIAVVRGLCLSAELHPRVPPLGAADLYVQQPLTAHVAHNMLTRSHTDRYRERYACHSALDCRWTSC